MTSSPDPSAVSEARVRMEGSGHVTLKRFAPPSGMKSSYRVFLFRRLATGGDVTTASAATDDDVNNFQLLGERNVALG